MSEELFDSLNRNQQEILLSLVDLSQEEEKICKKLNARMPNESGVVFDSGGVTVCEDEDDWRVITIKDRKKLDEIREKIKKKVNEALNCGLGFLGFIQRQVDNYEVKI